MKPKTFLIALLALLLIAGAAWATTSGELVISWWTTSAGGGTLTNGDYSLSATAGQAEAGALLEGGDYQLSGGYWPGGEAEPETSDGHKIYLPSIIGS